MNEPVIEANDCQRQPGLAPATCSATRTSKIIQRGIKIVWGYNDAPKLPDDWTIKRCAEAAAVAIAPDGKEYLIGDGVLYPWLTCPPEGLPMSSLKPGQKYLDTHAAIKLPNDQAETSAGRKRERQ